MIFSIITATLNRAHYLGAAIESVLAQGFPDFEHIIVDGGSTDGTPALLAQYPHLRVICEPDRGLYDAMNKGLRAAKGEFIGILNSDDLYVPGVFSRVAEARDLAEVVSGGAHIFRDDGAVIREALAVREIELGFRNVLAGMPLLNARFFRRSFADRIGEFDLAYRISADREWLLRALLAQPRETLVPSLLYRYRSHDGSLTLDAGDRSAAVYREEHATFAEKHLAGQNLAPRARRELRAYHMRESVAAAAAHWKCGRTDEMREWARRGRAQNALWPLSFARRLVGQALGR